LLVDPVVDVHTFSPGGEVITTWGEHGRRVEGGRGVEGARR
jgi:hypothetical protein